jgi:short-subunit dehydrogenase
MDIADRHVLVTGGSRGIGRAIAEAFAASGARVSATARAASSVADLAAGWGGTGHGSDLSSAVGMEGLIGEVEAAAGPIDVLVNNAGMEVHQHLAEQEADEVAQVLTTNLLAPVELTRQVLPGMLERGRGHVVNMASMAGAVGFPGLTTYASSKAGLIAFSRTLRMDLRGQPVGVTSVEIGTVPTDMLDAIEDETAYAPARDSFKRVADLRLMVHVAKEDVATAVVRAVEQDKRTVRLPRRAFAFPAITAVPQRIGELLLLGVPRHGDT